MENNLLSFEVAEMYLFMKSERFQKGGFTFFCMKDDRLPEKKRSEIIAFEPVTLN